VRLREASPHSVSRECSNPRCRASLAGRRADAKACSQYCATVARRIVRRIRRAYHHPRCVVCNAPMDWNPKPFGEPNLTLRAVTCSRKCAYTRANWLRAA
jgi:hypothetical protein